MNYKNTKIETDKLQFQFEEQSVDESALVNSLSLDLLQEINDLYKDDFFKNEIVDTEFIPETSDQIKQIELLENISIDGYSIKNPELSAFEANDFDISLRELGPVRNAIILKMPSKVFVQNEKNFNIKVRLVKSKQIISQNIMAKFLSGSFCFSETMIKLSEQESIVKLTKKKYFSNFEIKLKIYVDNEVVNIKYFDLYSRKIWD